MLKINTKKYLNDDLEYILSSKIIIYISIGGIVVQS
jgi:hypothetical protein